MSQEKTCEHTFYSKTVKNLGLKYDTQGVLW